MNSKTTPRDIKNLDFNSTQYITINADEIAQDIYDNYRNAFFYKLKNMPFGSCHLGAVRVDWNGNNVYHIFLKSYSTIVCGFTLLDDDSFIAWCTGTYSQTTRKHINRFCHEICEQVNYYWFKQLAETGNQAIHYTNYPTIVNLVTHNINRYGG